MKFFSTFLGAFILLMVPLSSIYAGYHLWIRGAVFSTIVVVCACVAFCAAVFDLTHCQDSRK